MGSDEQLKNRLSATPGTLPGFIGDLGDVSRRTARRRRRRLVFNVVAGVLVGSGVVVPLVVIAPLAKHGPQHPVGTSPTGTSSPTPSRSQQGSDPLSWPPLRHVSLVPQQVISSNADTLVIEAPIGVARWTLHGCDVVGGPANLNMHPSGGFGSGVCGGGTQLSAGVGGLNICPSRCKAQGSGTFYDVLSGRTLPEPGVSIVVTFTDGTKTTVTPSLGLWMVVFIPHPMMYNPTSPIAIVRAIGPDGTILATERV